MFVLKPHTVLPMVVLALFTGCAPDAKVSNLDSLREEFLTDQLPEVAYSVEQLVALESLDSVAVVGRIHGGQLDPFDDNSASFTLTVLPEPGHTHDDPGDCPFCKRKAENAPMVLVQFHGDDGKPLNFPVDELFGLEKNQDVVVSGSGSRLEDMLILRADSISIVADLESAHSLVAPNPAPAPDPTE